jgi:hypothetical protein
MSDELTTVNGPEMADPPANPDQNPKTDTSTGKGDRGIVITPKSASVAPTSVSME